MKPNQFLVYADWLNEPVGNLTWDLARGKEQFSFNYYESWVNSSAGPMLDPDLRMHTGTQYPTNGGQFGFVNDALPDSWGRKVMRATGAAYEHVLLTYLPDFTRMGGLRFEHAAADPIGKPLHAPKWKEAGELQALALLFQKKPASLNSSDLSRLSQAAANLGGGRPKANLLDGSGQLWIAKFPSVNDAIDKAAWEYLAYLLAGQCGIPMAESRLEHVHGKHRTFFTKRFDRNGTNRIHFASAMTMTSNHEELIRDYHPSYLEIAEFMQKNIKQPELALPELWRRIVFNIAISNTDDHLRNHGFLLQGNEWALSPAYDLNPSVEKQGLGLNIDMESNALDFNLARSVGEYFELSPPQMEFIITQVQDSIANWRELATDLSIPRSEQESMAPAFRPGQQSKRKQRIRL